MAYTVVFVEDEELVRQEIISSIRWKALGLKLVGVAADGAEGERLIKALEPDIVITDIRLPAQDGLAMLASCPVDHAIILTGHTDFTYMKQAIRLGVFDYLLKPASDEELEEALTSLVQKIQEEDRDVEQINRRHREHDHSITLPKHFKNHVIDSAVSFIVDNYSQSVGLQEAANHLGVSESHLSRLFKEVTGLNFLQYLNAYRINKSIEAMDDPKKNIAEIATSCGFPTPGYYAKIFKRFLGKTPTQFRDALGSPQ